MGCSKSKTSDKSVMKKREHKANISIFDFDLLELIGNSIFGQIYKVRLKYSGKIYAMKVYRKEYVVAMRGLNSINSEFSYLKNHSGKCRFITQLFYAFQDSHNLYLVVEFIEGGDLRFHMNNRKFSESEVIFIVSNLILFLEYVHLPGVAYKDLQPSNILLDKNGYLKFSDFKFVKEVSQMNFEDNFGTPGYLAPEILFRQSHGCSVDIFSLGIIAYEMIMGVPPFKCTNRSEYKALLLNESVQIKSSEITQRCSHYLADFINKCLQKKPINRLGCNGIEDLRQHTTFSNNGYDNDVFEEISQGKYLSAFIPNLEKKNFSPREKEVAKVDCLSEYLQILELKQVFLYYSFKRPESHKTDTQESKERDENTNEL